MSDTEDGNDGGDGFDKEAEREKLREQYEKDRKRREATQQMSELLLKGATMTDQHCDDCGSPIFRYEGEAFCPTCAGARAAEGEQAQQAGGQQAGGQGADQQAAEGQRGGQQPGVQGGQPTVDAGERTPDPGASSGGSAEEPEQPAAGDAGVDDADLEAARKRLDERAGSGADVGRTTDRRADPPVGDSPVRQGEVPSMAQTRASLRRAIVSLSEQAAQSDDPTRAHNLLKGAREASEALAALEGTSGE